LYNRLAEQVTSASARSAFIAQVGALRTGGGTRPPTTPPTTTPPFSTADAPLSDALTKAATKLLAQHIGPIANVVVKRAASKAAGREAFFALLEDAVTEPGARASLRAELGQLR
jgi:serine/threonine-protein kinase